MDNRAIVHIVDDDVDLRRSLKMLLDSVGIEARTYPTADIFLKDYHPAPGIPACLLLDVRMPGLGGMPLLKKLHAEQTGLPVIMLTGHGDIPMSVHAMKLGAVDFLTKPFNHQRLLDLVQKVLSDTCPPGKAGLTRIDPHAAHERWELLTSREREVFELIVSGLSNKAVAAKFEISVRTVETHRAKIMNKLQARTLVDLVLLRLSLDRPLDRF
jgi:FixJ family two-component response regulator